MWKEPKIELNNDVLCWVNMNLPAEMETAEKVPEVRPDIVESYRDFQPPGRLRKTVDDLVDAVPPKYLVGLIKIVLTNQAALTRDQRRKKVWSRRKMYRLAESLGSYSRAWKSSPATVWLYVDNIFKAAPSWVSRVPLLRHTIVGTVLYHEIGHHIHAVHRPVYDGKENVAEDWSRKLGRQFIRQRYWYLMPVLYPVSYLLNLGKRIRKLLRRRLTPQS